VTLIVTVPGGTPSQRADLSATGQNPVQGMIETLTAAMVQDAIGVVPAVAATSDATAPINVVLAPLGHTPGLYLVVYSEWVITVPTTGNTTCNLQWNAPTAIPISQLVSSAVSMVTNRVINTVARVVRSDGSAPIQLANTFAAVTGTALVAWSGRAMLVGT